MSSCPLTLTAVVEHGYSEVQLPWMSIGRGADRVLAGLQQGHLGEQQRGRQRHRGELL